MSMQSSNSTDAYQRSVFSDAIASAVAHEAARLREFLEDGGLEPLGCTMEQRMAELEAVMAQLDEAFSTEGGDFASMMAQDDDLPSVGDTFCLEDLHAADTASSTHDYIDLTGSPVVDCSLNVEGSSTAGASIYFVGSSTVDGSIYLEDSPDVKGSSPEVEYATREEWLRAIEREFPVDSQLAVGGPYPVLLECPKLIRADDSNWNGPGSP
ncbi:hypothetical protein CPLU01_13800 [Colletotrichum plurivorum]|uniref:Uncharacterized protein n=1 Tax=Colletotrichum plurivorum TaxID=2175906 RepID=A0A8H6JNX7_9PEZI|nr:hypothetical protein CPLU01_13800 [Colletotrichum plurivorum]